MASGILRLPHELLQLVTSLLSHEDILNLGRTNSRIREALARDIFHEVHYTISESDVNGVYKMAERYGRHIKIFNVLGSIMDDGRMFSWWQGDLLAPPNTLEHRTELLRGNLLPNLQVLRIEFDIQFRDWAKDAERSLQSMLAGVSSESFEVMQSEERREVWRSLVAEIWKALVRNRRIKKLAVKKMLPKFTSVFQTEDYYAFMQQLDELELEIFCPDNCRGSGVRHRVYTGFIKRLDEHMFSQMTSLTSLKLVLSSTFCYGSQGPSDRYMILKPHTLPNLKIFELENSVVNSELADFLEAHAAKLQSLRLKDVVCPLNFNYWSSRDQMRWRDFFNRLSEAKPCLSELLITFGRGPMTNMLLRGVSDIEEKAEFLSNSKKRKIFVYSEYLEGRGGLWESPEYTIERFEDGRDQKAYNDLMALAQKNSAATEEA